MLKINDPNLVAELSASTNKKEFEDKVKQALEKDPTAITDLADFMTQPYPTTVNIDPAAFHSLDSTTVSSIFSNGNITASSVFTGRLHVGPEGILERAQDLIKLAQENGVVLRIDLESKEPLAMGNFEMIPSVRLAHGHY